MQTPVVKDLTPYDHTQTEKIREDLIRDGFARLPGKLAPEEIEALKAGIDRIFADPKYVESYNSDLGFIALRLFETDPLFVDMLTREPYISLMESLLGANCHLMAQNGQRNAPGQAIDTYHVDDTLIFPVPEGVERHDARLRLPFFYFNVMFALTDIPSREYGPTQVIPGSHYSGRYPNDPYEPDFEGRAPVDLLCEAGEGYILNGQTWHRAAPNQSDGFRYIYGMVFSMRFVAQRLYPYVEYKLPPEVLERADERCKRVLGFHARGAYG